MPKGEVVASLKTEVQKMLNMPKFSSIEIYELLKPGNILPDDSSQVIAMYTKEIMATINKSVENIETKYITQMKRRA